MVGSAAYQMLFEHSADGVLFSTPDGDIGAANPAACALLAMTEEEIRRAGLFALVDREDPRWDLTQAERDRTGRAVGVCRFRHGNGRLIDLELRTLLFRDADGRPLSLNVLHDIAGRIATERAMKELSARLEELSLGDELTGMYNRRGLIANGTRLLERADLQDIHVQILFADVHNVADLNARLGHQGGDAGLQAVARSLAVAFRSTDVLARIGGTQFLVLAYDLHESDRATVTKRILRHLDAPDTVGFVGAEVGITLGWASRRPGNVASLEELRGTFGLGHARVARGDRGHRDQAVRSHRLRRHRIPGAVGHVGEAPWSYTRRGRSRPSAWPPTG